MKVAALALFCLSGCAHALEVHEWGTFTVLSDSFGKMSPWYISTSDVFYLPEFVGKPRGGKSGFSLIRMETPVLYFYPKETTAISVEVAFENGLITETFPFRKPTPQPMPFQAGEALRTALWTGTLFPPDHLPALANVPVIKPSDEPEPYGAAREVPGAWIFQADHTQSPYVDNGHPNFPQADHFIFYRGAGNAQLPLSGYLSTDESEICLNSENPKKITFAVALKVVGNQAEWKPLRKGAGSSSPAKALFAKKLRPLDDIENELRVAWNTALTEHGLSTAEAAAMVNTWAKTWFREPGVRILSVVPRDWPDQVLSLTITPTPEKTTRVFVARIEIIAHEKVKELGAFLSGDSPPTKESLATFKSFELGRFSRAAAQMSANLGGELTVKMAEKMAGELLKKRILERSEEFHNLR